MNSPNDSTGGCCPPSPGSAWREVSKDEFYRAIDTQNVTPHIVNEKWPYTSDFMTPDRQVRGKCVGYLPEGAVFSSRKYYLPNP